MWGAGYASGMKWTVKLVTEVVPGEPIEQEMATLEREDLVSPANVGLAVAEGNHVRQGFVLDCHTQVLAETEDQLSARNGSRPDRSFRPPA